ncbi:leucine-rich repeat and calponin homology domain-containing protein 1 isoform X6 [Peromyscus californicus insignis]|uniref:leucine-rich repeat and calponin homology domain-containing protein 1 isoform X6 n=1 Tax=Peromyscus californicus insignis TaxID=564181 RepID=UPI0022A766FF|nr:leucine-rich repeat and calponin homology domain-containing protein 1 isoform X6 [Peromyscus californicus insignis]
MATPGSEPQAFTPALSVTTLHPHLHQHHQHHGSTGGAGFNLPLNRGLERALEEAANSGGLNLSARKLKEFPRTAAPGHDLSDTVQADLSKNRLVEVPMELCHFVSLEILNLYHNCIRVIPEAIVNLQMLTYLNLSRNQLSALPACLCGLPLKVLIASNNKLGSLPEEIGQLKQLMELDVSCNEITTLPQQIGQLKSLRELNVRRNYLKVLPPELVDLPLVKFDFSCNKVLVIPICFREMKQLQVLLLENNPLQSPPAQICTKGKVHIFKYLSIQACQIKTTDPLYLHAMERPHLHQHVEDSKKDSDSGVGSDNGDKRLSATEPSDEDTVSLNVPMSNIMEEDQTIKEDACHRLTPAKGEFQPKPSLLGASNSSGQERDQFADGADALHSGFMNYIKDQAEDCEELLRIEEDAHWPMEGLLGSSKDQDLDISMIEQLREAEDLLQDPNGLSTDITERSILNLYPVGSAEALELPDSTLNGQPQLETSPECEVQNDLMLQSNGSQYSPNEMRENSPSMSPTANVPAPFGLKPRSGSWCPDELKGNLKAESYPRCPQLLSEHVFLRPQRNLESIDPQFTIRRKMEQLREEKELVEQLRESIEMRLKVTLHEDLGAALMDGVVLCHLANHIRPRSVASIHVPSPAVPKLSMAKCRRNVENFLEACRKLGVPEEKLCLPHHILEEKGLVKVGMTVQALLDVTVTKALFT